MSSLPPVHNTPNHNIVDAIKAALSSSLVFNDLYNNSFTFDKDNRGIDPTNPATPPSSFYAEATWSGPGFVGSISADTHNLILVDSASTVTIKPGDRAGTPDQSVTVAIGGGSAATFNDTIGTAYHVYAGEGDNKVTLNNGADIFASTTGNDLVKSGGGLDTISGGSGHDTIYAGGKSFVQAGTAGDKIFSSTLPGGSDTIQAGAGSDTIQLYAGNNSVIGSTGNTFLNAGTGNDTFDGSSATGNESIAGGTGQLTANLSAQGNDTIFGQSGHDVTVNLDESASSAGIGTDKGTGITTIHFTGGQTIEVKNVNITFNDGTKAHY